MSAPTRSGPGARAQATSLDARKTWGMLRRMVLTLTADALWRVIGHALPDGTKEGRDAEVFSGIGFYSRPPSNGNPEALVVFPAGASAPIVIACRDEETRRTIAASIAAGETMIYSGGSTPAMVYVKADGTVEIRTPAGAAVSLAKTSELNALKSHYAAHVHVETGASTNVPTSAGTAPTATGTTVLKGQ